MIHHFGYTLAKITMLVILYSTAFFTDRILVQVQSGTFTKDDITGPFAALILAVVALYILWKYLRSKDKEIINLRNKIDEDKNRQIQELKEQLKKK